VALLYLSGRLGRYINRRYLSRTAPLRVVCFARGLSRLTIACSFHARGTSCSWTLDSTLSNEPRPRVGVRPQKATHSTQQKGPGRTFPDRERGEEGDVATDIHNTSRRVHRDSRARTLIPRCAPTMGSQSYFDTHPRPDPAYEQGEARQVADAIDRGEQQSSIWVESPC
jgi:hypothetical protein